MSRHCLVPQDFYTLMEYGVMKAKSKELALIMAQVQDDLIFEKAVYGVRPAFMVVDDPIKSRDNRLVNANLLFDEEAPNEADAFEFDHEHNFRDIRADNVVGTEQVDFDKVMAAKETLEKGGKEYHE